jgi:AcrR family transcriptional regulator
MVRQSVRTQSTIEAILAAARLLFTRDGFEGTSVDEIAALAGVAKGAVYHHFPSKEAIFTRVLEDVQAEIAARPPPASARALKDPLDAIAQGVLRYLKAATEPQNRRVLLIDGPVVIGWRKWREIDDRYFGAGARAAVAHVLGTGATARDIAAIKHLLMGAVMEAALVCAVADDPGRAARDMTNGLRRLLAGLSSH